MKERPILFSAPMVRAILNGSKTQTRRIVKPSPDPLVVGFMWDDVDLEWLDLGPSSDSPHAGPGLFCTRRCPYGQPGDRLWVRETWARVPSTAYRCSDGVQQTICPTDPDMAAVYAAGWDRSRPGRWRPSIHMPRWASRITLEITGVRVERLNEISEDDCKAEGITADQAERCDGYDYQHGYRAAYGALWDAINGEGAWVKNPWVWVVAFKRVTP